VETTGYSGTPSGPEQGRPPADDFGFFAPAPTPVVSEPSQEEDDAPAVTQPEPAFEGFADPTPASAPQEPVAVMVTETLEPAAPVTLEPAAGLEDRAPDPLGVPTLLVDEPAPVNDPGPLGGALPMSLAIAAEEASRVEIVEEAEPSRPSFEEMYSQAEAAAVPDVEPAVDEGGSSSAPMDLGVELGLEPVADVGVDQYDDAYGASVVGLMETEALEENYQRTSTEAEGSDGIVLADLLIHVLESGASDLHLTAGARPAVRLHGHLEQMADFPVLTPPVIQRVMYAAITQRQREKFEEELELDFAYSVPGRARFRVNLYRQRDAIGAAFRLIPFEIKKLEDLGVPPQVGSFANMPRGMVLVTGPTGSGKSTTLASIVDLANRTRKDHIMTCEDPIEFLHRHQQCIVNQREVGEDTRSFANALKHVLRQDPDIILVGEMRDLETISIALTAAETGHLVFATLHTQDAAQTIDRMIDAFPPHQQQQVRTQLAGAIQGVVCQTLCRTADGKGRVVACEVLTATPAVRNLIREGKTHQIYSSMQAGAKFGMQTMDQHLADLCNKGRISYETGLDKCHHIEDFNRLTGRG
jgi:twitching motility protein PilT